MSTTYFFDGQTFSLKVSNPEDEDSTKDQEDEEETEKDVPKKRSTRKRKKTAKAINADTETKENDEGFLWLKSKFLKSPTSFEFKSVLNCKELKFTKMPLLRHNKSHFCSRCFLDSQKQENIS